jgi:hypothetical protein
MKDSKQKYMKQLAAQETAVIHTRIFGRWFPFNDCGVILNKLLDVHIDRWTGQQGFALIETGDDVLSSGQ